LGQSPHIYYYYYYYHLLAESTTESPLTNTAQVQEYDMKKRRKVRKREKGKKINLIESEV